jgi:hypothetical protein
MTRAAFRPLCFDLATRTGWAFHDGARPVCGLWELDAPFGNERPAKIDSFSRRLTLAVQEHQPTVIAAESPLVPMAHGGTARFDVNALLTSWGLFTHLELACRRLAIPFRSVNSAEIKKAATGHGARWKDADGTWHRPDKAMVLAGMRVRYPELEIQSHDVADALGILTLLMAEHRAGAATRPALAIPIRAKKVRGRRPSAA